MKKNNFKNIKIKYFPEKNTFSYYKTKINYCMIKNSIGLLEEVFIQFLKKIKIHLVHLLNCNIYTKIVDIQVHTYKKFLSSLNSEYSINKTELEKNLGKTYFLFPLKVSSLMLKYIFGYTNRNNKETKNYNSLTKTDYYMKQKFLHIVLQSFHLSLKEKFCIKIQNLCSENNVCLLSIKEEKKEEHVYLSFQIFFNNTKINLFIIIPYSTLYNINQYLILNKNDTKKNCDNWKNLILLSVKNITLNLSARSKKYTVPLHTIKNMKIGDIIPINNPENTDIYIKNNVVIKGKHGIINGKTAIKINHFT